MAAINRRKFVAEGLLGSVGLVLATASSKAMSLETERHVAELRNKDWMKTVLAFRKIDAHAHVYSGGSFDEPENVIGYADRLGISKLMISCYLHPHTKGTPEQFRESNNRVIKSMKAYPDRFIGTIVLNPRYQKESLEEMDRCRDAGMIGLGELYNQTKINDPLYYPIIEKCIDLNWNIMMHSAIGYSRVKLNPQEPKNISLPEDFVDVAKRYPEGMFQYAHIAGGIDWENACKILKDSPNVLVGVAGSNNAANLIDFAMDYIGEDRLVFGCDNSFYQGVGHMFSAHLTDEQRRKIFYDNISKRLKKGGLHVD